MSMAVDFGYEEYEEADGDYFYEEEEVLIAEVVHACCGRVQAYYNCGEADVPTAETLCRDCTPRVERDLTDPDFTDPFAEAA